MVSALPCITHSFSEEMAIKSTIYASWAQHSLRKGQAGTNWAFSLTCFCNDTPSVLKLLSIKKPFLTYILVQLPRFNTPGKIHLWKLWWSHLKRIHSPWGNDHLLQGEWVPQFMTSKISLSIFQIIFRHQIYLNITKS